MSASVCGCRGTVTNALTEARVGDERLGKSSAAFVEEADLHERRPELERRLDLGHHIVNDCSDIVIASAGSAHSLMSRAVRGLPLSHVKFAKAKGSGFVFVVSVSHICARPAVESDAVATSASAESIFFIVLVVWVGNLRATS